MKHKHYDLILAWANGAEIQCRVTGVWFDCDPSWETYLEYRRKPTMVKVGRHQWPEPIKEYMPGMTARVFSFEYTGVPELFTECVIKQAILEGVAHETKEAAEQHRAALRCINRGDIN